MHTKQYAVTYFTLPYIGQFCRSGLKIRIIVYCLFVTFFCCRKKPLHMITFEIICGEIVTPRYSYISRKNFELTVDLSRCAKFI